MLGQRTSFIKRIQANLLYILLFSIVIGMSVLFRIGIIAGWEQFEYFLIKRLHISKNVTSTLNFSIWTVSIIVIFLICIKQWLGKREKSKKK